MCGESRKHGSEWEGEDGNIFSRPYHFVTLLGYGVSEFSVTGIDAVIDPKNPLAFPIKLESNRDRFSFKIRAEAFPEPSEIAGIVTSAAFFAGLVFKRKRKLEDDSVILEELAIESDLEIA